MKKIFSLTFSLILCMISVHAQVADSDTLVQMLKSEVNYYLDSLKSQPVPAYFISFRVTDDKSLRISSDFGAASCDENHLRMLTPQVRVGNAEFDNYKYSSQNTVIRNIFDNGGAVVLPLDDISLPAIRQAIWSGMKDKYEGAVNMYENAKTQMATNNSMVDKSPCFSSAPSEHYYEQPLPLSVCDIDRSKWKGLLNQVSSVFKDCKELTQGKASLDFSVIRTYVVTSEGTIVVQNRKEYRILIQASIDATDGMNCPLYKDFFAYSENELPEQVELVSVAKDLTNRLLALRNAPLADAYAGPAILSGNASGVFFHEIFGHRIEGSRMKTANSDFKGMVGKQVLPLNIQVTSNPMLKMYQGKPLNGYYLYDDEGSKAQCVTCVKNGILQNFLMTRVPIDGFSCSNGHARAAIGLEPVSRQSNLIVETSNPYTEEQLRQMLIAELRHQKKEYGYYFRTVTSGWTRQGSKNAINSFNVDPVEVYRVYADGRPDQLVRGVSLIGTPLSVFSNIQAAGDKMELFTGSCGAESGWVPVSATAPMIYVSQIETQRNTAFSYPKKDMLPRPENIAKSDLQGLDEEGIIFKAMKDEMKRAKNDLKMDGSQLPFFVDYKIKRSSTVEVQSSLGSCFRSTADNISNIGQVEILLGDRMITSDNSNYHFSKENLLNLPDQVDYDNIRYGLWKMGSERYRIAVNEFSDKMNRLKRNPIPETEASVPEFNEMPPKVCICPSALLNRCEPEQMVHLANELSSIFLNYPQLFNTRIIITQRRQDYYRLTSEGQQMLIPLAYFNVSARAEVRTKDKNTITRFMAIPVQRIEDLPSKESMVAQINTFAKSLIATGQSSSVEDFYIGPVMYEDESVADVMLNEGIRKYIHSHRNIVTNYYDKNYRYLNKPVIDIKINVSQLGNVSSYKGTKLLGCYSQDIDGIAPATLPLIEKGILKKMLSGREPSVGSLYSTGNECLNERTLLNTYQEGVLHVSSDKSVSMKKVRSTLISKAKKAKLKYAYIFRSSNTARYELVRLDITTGKEEIVRASDRGIPSMTEMMHISAVSKEEYISNSGQTFNNFNSSFIVPKAIVVEQVNLDLSKPRAEDANSEFFKWRH